MELMRLLYILHKTFIAGNGTFGIINAIQLDWTGLAISLIGLFVGVGTLVFVYGEGEE